MIDFSQFNTYTGESTPPQRRQTNVTGSKGTNQELEYKRQKDQEARYAKNYEAYKKETNIDDKKVDASAIVSTTNREIISEDINDYNDTQREMLQSSPDKTLTPEQLKQLEIKRTAMAVKFNQFKEYDTNYRTVKDEIDKDVRADYDVEAFKAEEDKYKKTGKFELRNAPLRDLDPAEAVITKVNKLPDIPNVAIGGQVGKAKINPNTPEGQKEIDTVIAKSMYENPRARNTMVKLFDKLPWQVKMTFLFDEDGDKVYDKSEYDNAYIRFAQSNPELRKRAIGFEPDKITKETTTTGTFNTKVAVSSTNNKNTTYDVQNNVPIGNKTYSTFINLGQAGNIKRTLPIYKATDLSTGEEINFNNTAEFRTVGYSPSEDEIVIVVDDMQSSPTTKTRLRAGARYALKVSNVVEYNDFLRNPKTFGVYTPDLIKQYGTPTQGTTKKILYPR